MGELRIGVSGWNYPEWRGVVYPAGLVQRRELEWLGGRLNSIEINGTFYSLQSPNSFRKWAEQTPDGLVFALKGSKFITHQKKLADVRVPLANFFASGPLVLGRMHSAFRSSHALHILLFVQFYAIISELGSLKIWADGVCCRGSCVRRPVMGRPYNTFLQILGKRGDFCGLTVATTSTYLSHGPFGTAWDSGTEKFFFEFGVKFGASRR